MIFLKRDPPNDSIIQSKWYLPAALLIITVFVINTISGTYTNSSFPVIKDGVRDSSLEFTSSLQIAIEYSTSVKIFGDSILPVYPTAMYPDIIANSRDTFSVFFLDTANNAIKKFDIRIAGAAPILTTPVKIMDAFTINECYLHADKGETGYLVSLANKAQNSQLALRVGNGNRYMDVDTTVSRSGWLFSSQCHMEKDTFLIAYSLDANIVKLMKILSSGNTIEIIKVVTVSKDTGVAATHFNCSVASDKKGGILLSWSSGVANNGKKSINFRFYSRDLSVLQSGVLTENVGDSTFYYYDDSPVAAIDSMTFAVVHWDKSGIYLNILGLNNGILARSISKIVSAPDVKFATIASSKNECVVAYLRDTTHNNQVAIEGIHYELQNGAPVNRSQYQLSKPGNLKLQDKYHIVINDAVNNNGDFAVTWRYSNRVQGSVWSEREIRYKNGFWTSNVESLSVNHGDSIRFYPGVISAANTASWDINSYIRTGSSISDCSNSSWISLTDDVELERNKSDNTCFQYKISVKRNSSGDSLNTPSITSITIPFNIQPQIFTIDSIKIGNGTFKPMIASDTIDVLSRSDSVRLMVTVYDRDPSEKLYLKASYPGNGASEELSGTFPLMGSVLLAAANHDTVTQCTLSVRDSRGWNARPVVLNYKSKNAIPRLTVVGEFDNTQGVQETIPISDGQHIFIQETDSLQLIYNVSDPNDTGRVTGYVFAVNESIVYKIDSTDQNGDGRFCIHGDTVKPASQYVYQITTTDEDTSCIITVYLHVNHSPVIKKLTIDGLNVTSGDTAKTKIGQLVAVAVSVHDTDCYFSDTLTYRLLIPETTTTISSNLESIVFQWIPSQTDSVIKISVSDRYGKSDSMYYFQKYPWFERDRKIFSAYTEALDTLTKVSLIVSSNQGDTIMLPVFNNGSDTLKIESLQVNTKAGKWFKLGIPFDTGFHIMESQFPVIFDTLHIAPGEKRIFRCYFTADSLSGDNVLADTVFITTNDYSHSIIPVPIRFEYNDLPRVVSIGPDFSANIPWHLSKRKVSEYTFPPHASVSIQFSEPMDTASIQKGLTIYSRKDSLVSSVENQIRVRREWSQNYTKLNCFASYDKPSAAFSLFPPESLFIPTDNLAVRLNGDITDKASTPSGPNALDVDLDSRRNSASDDTTVTLNVDSIYFSVLSISPLPYDTQVKVKPVITLSFSSNVYSASVDRSFTGNQTLIIKSRYNGGVQLEYDSIAVDKNKVSFHIARKLFYCDSLWCRYNASSIKNSLGFQSDNNRDGIAVSMFGTSNTTDDLLWSYRVKNINIISHTPGKESSIKEISPAITLNFDDVVDESVIDTDTSNNNRSFKIGSIYESGFSSYQSISLLNNGKSVEIQPKRKFFSRDSIYFIFSGFNRNYRYEQSSNLPGFDSVENFDKMAWTFYTGNTGFYTFPNPYKPGNDPRHCEAKGPCGIWFKNLHVLKQGVNDLIVKVYSMNTHPVYNSQKAGDIIHFEENSPEYLPQWLWDTRNSKGELVASGLYFYTVSDLNNKVLTKGKIMIVR